MYFLYVVQLELENCCNSTKSTYTFSVYSCLVKEWRLFQLGHAILNMHTDTHIQHVYTIECAILQLKLGAPMDRNTLCIMHDIVATDSTFSVFV